MRTILLPQISLLVFQLVHAQGSNSSVHLNDINNNMSVTIGEQVWMKRNLDVITFANGDTIKEAQGPREWKRATENQQPAWCYYDNDHINGEKYGKLYNWYAVVDPRGIAPVGWHIPSDEEWSILIEALGGEEKAGAKLKSDFGWDNSIGKTGNGTNESTFTALPGGYRKGYDKVQ